MSEIYNPTEEIERLRAEKAEAEQEWAKLCVEREKPLRTEIERLNTVVIRGLAGVELSEENDRLIDKIKEAAAFLDRQAERLYAMRHTTTNEVAAECRQMAERLRK